MPNYRAIDLFAGAGGLSQGMRWAGIDVVLASDNNHWCEQTYITNNPETIFINTDVENLTKGKLTRHLSSKGITFENIDIVAGGPPCQGFSIIGPRKVDDPRNILFRHFAKIVRWIRPKVFVMENVFGLLSMDGGAVIEEILRSFREIDPNFNYVVSEPQILEAQKYGIPQYRRRVFIIGIRNDLTRYPLYYPQPVVTPEDYLTVWDAISDLPEKIVESEDDKGLPYRKKPRNDFQIWVRDNSKSIFGHHTKGMTDVRRARVEWLREGQIRTHLPPDLQSGGHENKYRRLVSTSPSPTITAHLAKDLAPFIHPKYHRWVTTREAARLQTFKDTYIFKGSEFQMFKQIGNAVPPLLSYHLFKSVLAQLNNVTQLSRYNLASKL